MRWDADEVTNLRAALVAGIAAGDLASALPVASVAGWHWYTHGSLEEGRLVTDLVADVLADGAADGDRADDLGGTVLVAGIICWARGELDDAAALLGRALAMAEAGHVVRRSAIAHAFLGHLARTSGDLDLAAAEHTLAQASFRALGNRLGDAWASHDLALVALGAGRVDDAAGLLAAALPVFAAEQDAWAVAWVGSGQAEVALRRHEWARAGELLVDALDVFVANGDQPRTAHCVALLAELATARGLDGQAERLEAGLRHPGSLPALARSVAEAAAAPESPLTPRQREVATLVAQGCHQPADRPARWASPTRPSRCTSRRSCTGSGCRTGPRWPPTPPTAASTTARTRGFPQLSVAPARPVDLNQAASRGAGTR